MKKLLALLLCGTVLTACEDGSGGSSGSSVNRHVTIVNNTGSTIQRFYGSNAGSNSWEEDVLGTDVLSSGQQVDVNFDDGSGYCTFDFRAVLADGSSQVINGVDVCTTGTVTFS